MTQLAAPPLTPVAPLSRPQRLVALFFAWAGWMLAGFEIAMFILITRPAIMDMFGSSPGAEQAAKTWLLYYQTAFLSGAATGGWVFGWLGDRQGRSVALAASMLCYSLVTGATWFVHDPVVMWFMRFIACMGVGGVWPNAVSLVTESWPTSWRPTLAAILGTGANIGFVLLGLVGYIWPVTPASWRWVLLVGAAPGVLGLLALKVVPESPLWKPGGRAETKKPIRAIFAPDLRYRTCIGIALGAVPVLGTAVSAIWLPLWTDMTAGAGNPQLKAWNIIARSSGAAVGGLVGGYLAGLLGRRTTYFLISGSSLIVSLVLYGVMKPGEPWFNTLVFLLGFTGVMYFGWLPLYLPELFPPRVRSTGTGVTFNSGRAIAALGALAATVVIHRYNPDYGQIGVLTSTVYIIGMLLIYFAPDTTKSKVE